MAANRIYLDNCCFNRPYDDQLNLNIHLEAEAKLFIQKENFDYTKWQENLFEDMMIEEIYTNAAKLRNNKSLPQD